jgi:hypothetical protein
MISERRPFRTLFVVGCPRSGTTWVQLLLARHPQVATAPETQIFAFYLDHFRRQWRWEHEGPGRKHQGQAGLSRLLSEDEFIELCALTAGRVLDKIAGRTPGAKVVVEKSPRHALEADFIQRVFPDAYFLHVVRDPRDTAASLLAAGRSWAPWAPRNAIAAARLWTSCVAGARRVSGTDRYLEVGYEALRSNAAGQLQAITRWLGIPQDHAACEETVRACELARLQKDAGNGQLPLPGEKSPTGFFRNGEVGSWRHELSRSDVRVIEQICGPLMASAGYQRAGDGRRSLRIRVHDSIQLVREKIDWQLQKLVRTV